MGDRFYLALNCAYCGTKNQVFYAPTCGFYDFVCGKNTDNENFICEMTTDKLSKGNVKTLGCGRTTFITADFNVKQIEDITEEDVIQAFEMASSTNHKLEAIKKEARHYLKELKKRI